MIKESDIECYIELPKCFMEGCSDKIVVFCADDGNHFISYGIYEGMFLFFDLEKDFKEGWLSCYVNKSDDGLPKYKLSDKDIEGYEHFGRLVMTMRNYEV